MAYIYQADTWCDACGQKIREELTAQGKAPEDPDDETSYDSGDFPKYYDAENEEADSPQNCGKTNQFLTYGTFLKNRLTSDGYQSLKSMLDEQGESLTTPADEWADYYQFIYHKNEYDSAHDWLEAEVSRLASGVTGAHSARLVEMVRELARELDSDQIQDLYQSDMDDDGYFKETGWYSEEMEYATV